MVLLRPFASSLGPVFVPDLDLDLGTGDNPARAPALFPITAATDPVHVQLQRVHDDSPSKLDLISVLCMPLLGPAKFPLIAV